MNLKNIFTFLILFTQNISAIPYFSDYKANDAYQNKDYKKAKEILEQEQVNDPDSPIISYNLGTINYMLENFTQAQLNFEHAINNSSSKKLKEIANFNLANSYYKNGLEALGSNWEKKDIEPQKLITASQEIEKAIEKYQKVLDLNDKNEKAKVNKKKAVGLLEKLKQEQEKQEQEKNDKDKENKDKKDQQKQDKEKQKKESSQQEDKSEEQKQEKQDRKDSSEQSENQKQDGENEQLDQEKESKDEQKQDNHDKNSSDKKDDQEQLQQSEKKLNQEEQENQEPENKQGQAAQGFEQKDQQSLDLKEKTMQVVLDKLQSEESDLQKKLILQKSKNNQKNLDSSQKPW